MKKIALLCIAAGLYACDTSNEENSEPTPNEYSPYNNPFVNAVPTFEIEDTQGNNLLSNGTYKLEELSISATDENWNQLYYPSGTPLIDIVGHLEIISIDKKNDGTPFAITIILANGMKRYDTTAHYLLKYDINKYDSIIVTAAPTQEKYIVTNINYNGVNVGVGDLIKIIKQ
jgi:hypothetical protein